MEKKPCKSAVMLLLGCLLSLAQFQCRVLHGHGGNKKKRACTKLLSKLKNMLFTSEMRQVFTEENNLSFRFSALTKNPLRLLIRFCLYTSLRIIIYSHKGCEQWGAED